MWYPDRVERPKYVRMRTKFPMNYNRKAEANIPFDDPTLHRTWKGEAPTLGQDPTDRTTRLPRPMNTAEYLWTNDATSVSKVPAGFIATSSGIEPLVDPPGTVGAQQGYPLHNPVEITEEFDNDNSPGEAEYWNTRFPTSELIGNRTQYTPVNPDAQYNIVWQSDGYIPPVYPEVRYPKQGYKLRKPYKDYY
jgi:hypothetical protein